MKLALQRIYEPADPSDGFRVLVDRLWPRGVSKERAALGLWAKDVAPSAELRTRWHASANDDWELYADEYRRELAGSAALEAFVDELRRHERVTFVYAAHDAERNHARVLADVVTQMPSSAQR